MRVPVLQFGAVYLAGLWFSGGVRIVTVLAVAVLLILLVVRASSWLRLLVVVGWVGAVTGAVARASQAATCREAWEPGSESAIIQILDEPGERLRTRAIVRHTAAGCGGALIVRLEEPVPSGAVLVVAGSYHGMGVFRVRHARLIGIERGWRLSVRSTIAHRIRALYGPRSAVVEALVLGRRDDIPPSLREAFIGAGIAHLLAISGLHVGLFVGWIVLLVRLTHLRRWAPAIGATTAWFYVMLLGFPVAATRAAAFITIFVFARYRQRHPVASAVLTVGALVVASIDPNAVRSVGAWLSISAVWATMYGPAQLPSRWRTNPFARLAASSLAATIVTAPITAFTFGSVAPIGIVSNLVAVPLAGIAVPAVFASLVVGPTMAAGAGLVLAAIEGLATTLSMVPGGHLVGAAGWSFAWPWLGVLVGTVWVLERRPRWGILQVRLAFASAVAAWAMVFFPVGGPKSGEGLTVHVLDVGQGDAIALRTREGRWILVDAGPISKFGNAGHRIVVPFLRRNGVKRLDALVISHGDADHLGGAPAVVGALQPRLVLEPGQPLATALYREHLAAVDAVGSSWQAGRAGDSLEIDGVRLLVLHPTARWADREFRPNENSLVLRLEYGCFSALLTGDIGFPVEEYLLRYLKPVDLLKVGHHGSAGSTGAGWLDTLRPLVAVVSVGQNRYGHPAPEVLERLDARGIETFRTDRDGTVTIRTDGRYLDVVTRDRDNLLGRLLCRIRRLLQSNNSSSNKNGCTPGRQVSLPVCSTISR